MVQPRAGEKIVRCGADKIPTSESDAFSFMADQRAAPETVRVKTGDGRHVELKCPICASSTFIAVRAPASEHGIGFQHVIAGREMRGGRQGAMLTLPVRFWACANCGYTLKFLITKEDGDAAVRN